MKKERIILDVVLFISLFLFPFPVFVALFLLGLVFFPFYWETLVAVLFYVLIYRSLAGTGFLPVLLAPLSVLLFMIIQRMRSVMTERIFRI